MSQKKFLDKIGLQNFLNRIKALIPTKTSELQNDSGFITSEGTYDSALSLESEKAVQNKVVTAAINGKQDTLSTAQTNAVDSGITSSKVQGYDSHITDTDIHVTQADKTSWDSKAPGTHTHLASEVSGLSTVATSGSYNDLSNKPSIPSKTSDLTNDSGFLTSHNPVDSALSSTSTNAVQNKVINTELGKKANTTDLATVATSGSYADLSNKPSIPSKTSDLTNDSGFLTSHNPIDSSLSSTSTNAVQNKVIKAELGKKANTTDLATVATSGSYNDLSNKPTIPTVNNATLTIQKNGTTVKTFTANSSTNVTADITVPTKVSELTNDSGFLTSHNPVDSALSTTSENAVQNKVVKAELDNKANSADLSTVATTGSYTDLNNIPSNFTPASHTHGSITNDGKLGTASRALITDGNKKIAVSSVTSTELGYLSGVTSAVQDQLDGKAASTHSHAASEVSGLATVATSGSYNDLANKPAIPTVNNATLTIQKNGTTVKTFTANASSNVTANITVPTKVSELTNDSGFLTSHNPVDSALSDTSTNAVQNKVVKAELDGKSDTGHTHTASEVSGLSTVATSGSYNDLSNKPTIPTVNNATLTIQKNGTTVKTFTANASSNVTANITVPTKVSELTNDSGFLTSASSLDSSKLTGTIDIARLPKGALERLVTVADQTARFALTTSDVQLGDTVKQLDTGVMYIVTDESKLSSADGYTEYTAGAATSVPWSGVTGKPSSYTPASHSHGNIANGGTLGTASRALITDTNKKITTSSVTSTELGYLSGVTSAVQTQLNGKAASSHTHTASEVSGLSTVATSGSYNDLSNKPTIDSALSSTSTNAVQNKVINTALAGKAASSHTHTKSQITDFPTKTSQFTNDSHQTITVGTDTTSTTSPAHSGTFTCIDSVTRDSNGHVTAVNTKTVTLPADNNTDTLVTQNVSTANENHPVLLTVTKDATANQGAKTSIFASGVKVNPSTNTVTATTFSGALSGNASTATQFSANKSVTLTGDVTGTASSKAGWSVATTLSDSGVTAGTYGPSADVTGNNNATISVPEITVDSKGRVTSVANRTLTCKNNTYNVYNKTLTIQKNGTNVATFTSNSNTDVTANITVPTKVSELTNDSGYLTSHQSLSNYVTLNGNQTITGAKTFQSGGTSIGIKATNHEKGVEPSGNQHNIIQFTDKNGVQTGFITKLKTSGYSCIQIASSDLYKNNAMAPDGTNVGAVFTVGTSTKGVPYWQAPMGAWESIYPHNERTTLTLGTSTNKWSNVYATTFTGNLTGNVTGNVTGNCSGSSGSCTGLAAKATGNANGKELTNTIIKGLSISGKTITYTQIDGTTGTLTTQDNNTWTAMVGATSSANGSVGYVNAVPPKDGYNTKYLRADGTWAVPPDHTYTVNNATLTIQKNGTNVATFTSNASSNATANITVPTKTSELTNDSGFLTSHQSLSNYVTLNGNQTISGAKTFTGGVTLSSTAKMTVNHATVVKGTNPSSVQYWQIFNCDKNGANWGTNTLSIIEGALDANGKSSIYFRACKNEANSTASGTLAVVYDSANNKTWAECPTPDASSNDTKIATTAFVYNNAAKHFYAATNIYVAKAATGNGSGSNTSNYMSLADLRTFLATAHTHSSASDLNGSYNLQLLFKAGDSFGNATFDATKMPGVRNLILNTSTGTNSTTDNYSTNSPTFGNITVTGDISVTMRNLNCTGRISSQYGAYVAIDTYMGISSLQATNYGFLNVAKNMVINVCDAHTDYLFSATNNGILAMWPGATVTINFRQQCYYTRCLFLASSNGTAWIGYSNFKLTGTEPMAVWGGSGTLTGTSETAAATAEKAVTLASGQTFTLTKNATAKVKFTIDNTAANPTLNIGGTGAKPIYWNNAAVPAAMLMKNITYDVKYNGSQFVIQNAVKRLTNNDFGVFRSTGNYDQTYNSGSWNFTGWALYYGTGIENSNWRGSHIGNIQQNVTSNNNTFPILFSGTANATANTSTAPYFGTGIKVNPSTSIISANGFSGAPETNYVQGVKDGGALVNSQTTSFGAVWRAPTKNYQVAGATFPNNNDTVYICYSVTNANVTAGTNTVAKQLTWAADTGTLTANAFSGSLTGNVTGNCSGSSGSCTGNSATATQFSANTTVALTGDATGTSAGSKKGWSVPVTLANSGVTAGTYGPSADVTGNNNATISVPQITVDAKGRVTSVTNRTLTCKNNTYTVNNATLTIQKNGTNVATFTSNASSNVTANITVPTKTSELTNNSGFLTSHQDLSLYPYKVASFSNYGNGRWQAINLGDTTTHPNGFNEIVATGKYQVRWTNATTVGVPFTTSAEVDGILEVDGISSASGVSSYQRVVQRIYRCSTAHIVYFRYGAYHDGTWNWSEWTSYGDIVTHNASEFLTSHQSLSNYSTLANTIKSLSISGKTITYTKGDNTTGTLTTQDTNTDTLMTQNVSTTNNKYPILLCPTAEATANQGAKTGIFGANALINPSTGEIISKSNGTGAFRVVGGNYGFFIRNDGSNTYFLMTASGDQYGTWTSARPLTINDSTGVCSINGNAATANKLATARSIALGNELAGSANFDGSGNITVNANAYLSVVGVGNKNNYPYHRFAYFGPITNTYQDAAIRLQVARQCINGGSGILEIEFRTNAKNGDGQCDVRWIVRSSKLPVDCIQIGFFKTWGGIYADVFCKSSGAYDSYVIRSMGDGSRGSYERKFTLQDCSEANNTTTSDPLTSVNSYASIAAAGTALHNQAYTDVLTATDAGVVETANTCSGNSATASKVVATVANDTTGTLVQGTMGSNDVFRIAVGGASNAGWAEIATGDDYNEPIYVRQYQGSFTTLKRTATLLDASGNTAFPGTVTASGFSGPLTGNVTGNCSGSSGSCTGNAATATQFSANKSVTLTGDVTGTASSKAGWSVATTLANSGVTAGSYGPTADVTGNNNATISVPEITVDAKGRVTSVVNRTLTCKNNTYTVNNATLTIQKNGSNVATFTSNASANATANITVPTKTSELTNDSGFLTSHQSLSNYLTKTTNVSEMGRYIDLHYDNATAAYDYDARIYVDSQGTAKGGGALKISAATAYAPAPASDANDTRIATTKWVKDRGYLTSHQSLSDYSTKANTVKSLSISGKTITVTPGSGSAYTLTTQDTVYTHPTSAGNKHVPSGGSSGQFLGWDSAGTAKWVNNPNTDTKVRQDVGTSSTERPILSRYNTEDASQTANYVVYDTGVTNNPKTHTLTASGGFKGNLTGNCSGTAANVTGTVAIANGGTGATSRLNAVKNLTNENVGTAATYFLGITNSWGKAGYISVADARTVLEIPTFSIEKFVWDHTINLSEMASSSAWEQITGGYKYTANVSLKAGQLTWIYVYLITSNDLIKIVITNGYILSGKNCVDGGKNSIKADTTTYGNVLTQTVCGSSRLNCLFYPYNSTVTLTMTYTILEHAGGENPTLSGKVLIKQ